MTMPNLSNCPHNGDGWCIPCVRAMQEEHEAEIERHVERANSLRRTERKHHKVDFRGFGRLWPPVRT